MGDFAVNRQRIIGLGITLCFSLCGVLNFNGRLHGLQNDTRAAQHLNQGKLPALIYTPDSNKVMGQFKQQPIIECAHEMDINR